MQHRASGPSSHSYSMSQDETIQCEQSMKQVLTYTQADVSAS